MKYKEKINILLGLILLLGPFFLFKTCNFSNNVMMCTYSSIFITAGGLIIAITNLVILKGKITNMNCSWFNGIGHSEAFHTHVY